METGEVKSSYSVISFPAKDLPEQYLNMILSKWMRALRYGNDYFKLVDSDSYFLYYNRFIKYLLQQKQTQVRLAVLSDNFDVVLGFAVYRGEVLDFVHVHKDMRKQGIARALVPDGITTFTHITRTAMNVWSEKRPELKFNPYA